MDDIEIAIILGVIDSINDDWALADDNDEHEYMVLIDSSRTEKEDLKPKKSLIKQMEKNGLIKTDDIFEEREYMNLLGESYPVPFVYMYEVTQEGRDFKKKYKNH